MTSVKRRQHIIKPNHRQGLPNQYIFVDTETSATEIDDLTVEHHLRLGVACYVRPARNKVTPREEWFSFTNAASFWEWVDHFTAPKTRLYIYAHNMGFDARALDTVNILKANGWTLKKMILKSPPFMLTFTRNNATIQLIDSMNYFSMSLAKLGESLKCDKGVMPEWEAPIDEWFSYCKQDVMVLRKAIETLIDLLKSEDLGGLKISLAATAMNIFRHKFMDHQISVHCNDDVLSLERSSYYGGRTEPFALGKQQGNFHLLDINSMYPHVMASNIYPINLIETVKDADAKQILKRCKTFTFTASVVIDTDTPLYPTRHDFKLVYPIGQFETSLASPELLLAIRNGHIRKINSLAIYESAPIFTRYCQTLYTLRQSYQRDGNKAFNLAVKLLLNSLYGKFGQQGIEWEQIADGTELEDGYYQEYDGDKHEMMEYRCLGGLIEKRIVRGESYESIPAIAAHVTSYARVLLQQLMNVCGVDNFIYCDTDSLIVNDTGLGNLQPYINQTTLGMLKYEGTACDVEIRGPKDYTFGGKTKLKGIRANAVKIDDLTYCQDRFDSFISSLRAGKSEGIKITRTTKKLTRKYTKAIIHPDGSLSPLILSLDDPI